MRKNSLMIKRLVGIAALSAIVVVLQLIAGYLPKLPGGLSISLTLVPIIIGGILYGPLAGGFLGLVMAVTVLIDPSTSVFFGVSIFGTVITVLLKSSVAGFISGLLFKLLYKKNFFVGLVVAAVVCPVINTGLFILFATLFFQSVFGGGIAVIFASVIMNFLVELGINVVLCPIIASIIKIVLRNFNLGTALDSSSVLKDVDESEI